MPNRRSLAGSGRIPPTASWATAAFLILAGVSGLLIVSLKAVYSPEYRFLPSRAGAEWIVFPLTPYYGTREARPMRAVFRRHLNVPQVPSQASLSLMAFQDARISINGTEVPFSRRDSGHWKVPITTDVAGWLKSGENVLELLVTCEIGPPAVWMRLDLPEAPLASDGSWQVRTSWSDWRPAPLATTSHYRRPGQDQPAIATSFTMRPLESLQALWTWMVALAAICGAVVAAGAAVSRNEVRRAAWAAHLKRRPWLIAAPIIGMALLLVARNAQHLHPTVGYDVEQHLEYVQYVRENWRLPGPSEGWQMYQPPPYYVAAAVAMTVAQLVSDTDGIAAIRLMNWSLLLVQLAFVFGILRLEFPDKPGFQALGLVFVACLPINLAIYQFVTNELMLATWGAGAVYFALRAMKSGGPRWRDYAGLGIFLGLALVTKVTAVLLAAVIVPLLAAQAWFRGSQRRTAAVGVALVFAISTLLSGWFYIRTYAQTGKLLVTNIDPAAGFSWWQDPGYVTSAYFLRGGEALQQPTESIFHSFFDTLYATFCGECLTGSMNPLMGGPWNYPLMALGYLIALVPLAVVAVGFGTTVARLVAQPAAERFVLVGLPAGFVLAMINLMAQYPYYGHAKAWYASSIFGILAILLAIGWERIHGWSRVAGLIVLVGLDAWAVNSYVSMWIRPDAAMTLAAYGVGEIRQGRFQSAVLRLRAALRSDPSLAPAKENLAIAHLSLGQPHAALPLLQDAAASAALDRSRRASILHMYGATLGALGDYEPAIELLRASLAERADWPEAAEVRKSLGRIMLALRQPEEAIREFRLALEIKDDEALALTLATLLLQTPQEQGGNPAEALVLVRELIGDGNGASVQQLEIMAAALAANSQIEEAITAARRGLDMARSSRDAIMVDRFERALQEYVRRQSLQPGC